MDVSVLISVVNTDLMLSSSQIYDIYNKCEFCIYNIHVFCVLNSLFQYKMLKFAIKGKFKRFFDIKT